MRCIDGRDGEKAVAVADAMVDGTGIGGNGGADARLLVSCFGGGDGVMAVGAWSAGVGECLRTRGVGCPGVGASKAAASVEVAVVGRRQRRRWRRRQRQFINVSVVSAVLAMVSGVGCNFVGFLNGSNCGVIAGHRLCLRHIFVLRSATHLFGGRNPAFSPAAWSWQLYMCVQLCVLQIR